MKEPWEPVDWIVFFLAVFVCVLFTIFAGIRAYEIIYQVVRSEKIDLETTRQWSAVISSIIAIITLYVGAKIKGSGSSGDRKGDQKPDDEHQRKDQDRLP